MVFSVCSGWLITRTTIAATIAPTSNKSVVNTRDDILDTPLLILKDPVDIYGNIRRKLLFTIILTKLLATLADPLLSHLIISNR